MVLRRVPLRQRDAVAERPADALQLVGGGDEPQGRRRCEARVGRRDAPERALEAPVDSREPGPRRQAEVGLAQRAKRPQERDEAVQRFGLVGGLRQGGAERRHERVHGGEALEEAEAGLVERAAVQQRRAERTGAGRAQPLVEAPLAHAVARAVEGAVERCRTARQRGAQQAAGIAAVDHGRDLRVGSGGGGREVEEGADGVHGLPRRDHEARDEDRPRAHEGGHPRSEVAEDEQERRALVR